MLIQNDVIRQHGTFGRAFYRLCEIPLCFNTKENPLNARLPTRPPPQPNFLTTIALTDNTWLHGQYFSEKSNLVVEKSTYGNHINPKTFY